MFLNWKNSPFRKKFTLLTLEKLYFYAFLLVFNVNSILYYINSFIFWAPSSFSIILLKQDLDDLLTSNAYALKLDWNLCYWKVREKKVVKIAAKSLKTKNAGFEWIALNVTSLTLLNVETFWQKKTFWQKETGRVVTVDIFYVDMKSALCWQKMTKTFRST